MSNTKSGTRRQIYAIGDVHGCATELESLLAHIPITRDTLIVFLGDYVDRGIDSRRVIDIVVDLKRRCEVVALMGNHEAMFLDFLERPESIGSGLFILNGGGSTLANYAGPNGSFEVPQSHVEFLKSLKLFYETESHFFVHAGVPLKKKLRDLDPVLDRETFLWTRGPFLTTTENWGKIVVHGHTPNAEPERRPNRINVDTGCVFGGHLTAYDVTNDTFISVERIPFDESAPPTLTESGSLRIAVRFNGRMPVSASKPGQRRLEFETLNYNQFGLLLRELRPMGIAVFENGDIIEGTIGDDHRTAVEFEGQIVRTESRQGLALYGVKIEKISTSNDTGSGGWINRPA
ncbi:MAG: metallophosphoesterase family protein [Bdellovibrionales bacterium]|jgi:serine/threonine protein phosphatase 1|nr:metallophosphoesterase family protein [Bdellovibrionales bacterium]